MWEERERESKETNNNILKDTRKASIIERERDSLSLWLWSREGETTQSLTREFNIPPSPTIRSRRVDTTPPPTTPKKNSGPTSWVFPLFSIVVKMSFKYLTLTLTPPATLIATHAHYPARQLHISLSLSDNHSETYWLI